MGTYLVMPLRMNIFSAIMFLQTLLILPFIPITIHQNRSAFHSVIQPQNRIGILLMTCNIDIMCHNIQVREDTLNLP